jgi:hypothetical protein
VLCILSAHFASSAGDFIHYSPFRLPLKFGLFEENMAFLGENQANLSKSGPFWEGALLRRHRFVAAIRFWDNTVKRSCGEN